jgi:hypothetical protein
MDQSLNPLRPDDCTVLNGCLQKAAGTAQIIAKCKDCGLPVEEYEALNNQHIELAQKLKANFFPHNP